MRISGLGYVDKNGVIQLHRNIVEGLSIFSGSILFGIFYPRSKEDKKSAPSRPDFMLTPIPFKLWPISARIIVRLNRQSIGLKAITKILSDNHATILNSISNRSAHRYSTWDIHIAFDNLNPKNLTWDENKSRYIEVNEQLRDLVNKISKSKIAKAALFTDDEDMNLNHSVRGRVNNGLHYFYRITKIRLKGATESEKLMYSPFSFRYSDGLIISNSGGKINSILNIAQDDNLKLPLPTVAFVEGDSHYLNVRIRLFPQEKLPQLLRISIYYERRTTRYSSRGLTEYLIQHFPKRWKLWKYWNQLYECRDEYGSGKLSFFVEDTDKDTDYTLVTECNKIINFIDRLNYSDNKPKDLSGITFRGEASAIFPNLIQDYFKEQRINLKKPRYDVFISYSSVDIESAKYVYSILTLAGNSCFLAKKDIIGGTAFPEVIREALLNSREVCVLCSKSSLISPWVITEWGTAWFLKKNIVPIIIDTTRKKIRKTHPRLMDFQDINFTESAISEYGQKLFSRRFEYLFDYDRHFYYGKS